MSRFSCAVTPSTRDAIGRRMITILKDPEFKNLDFKGLCNKMWLENFSKYAKNDKNVFALDCLSQIPMIINDNIRTHGDTDDETYRLLKSRFSEEDIKLIQKLDADLRTNDWFETAKELAGNISTSQKDQQVINNLISSENFVPRITKLKTIPYVGAHIVFNDTLYRVTGIDGNMLDAQPVDANDQVVGDAHLIRNVEEFYQPYQYPSGVSTVAEFRSEQFRDGDIFTFEPKMGKPDENGISELFFNAKRNGKDVKISFRSQEFPELYKISTDFGNIKDSNEFKTVYVKVKKSSAEQNVVTLEIMEPFIIGDGTDIELVNRPNIEQPQRTLADEFFFTMTSNIYRISQLAFNPNTRELFDNEHTGTPNNKNFQDRFVSAVKVSTSSEQASINGKDIRLVATIENGNVVLNVCDLEGNILKFKLDEDNSIKEAEDGQAVKFMLDDMLGLKDYNQLLKNKSPKSKRSIEQEFQANFYRENSFDEFIKRLENAKDNHATIESKVKNGEKVYFDITGIYSDRRKAYNYNVSKSDLEGHDFVVDTKTPKLRLNGTDFYLYMPAMSNEHIEYFVSLLTKELSSSPNIRLNNQQRFNLLNSFFHGGIALNSNVKLRFDLINNELIFSLQKDKLDAVAVAKFNSDSEFVNIDSFDSVINLFKKVYTQEYEFNNINNGFSRFQFAFDKKLISDKRLYKPTITDGVVDTQLYDYIDVLKEFEFRYDEYNRSYEVPTGVFKLQYHSYQQAEVHKVESIDEEQKNYLDVDELYTSIEAKAHITHASENDILAAKIWFENNPISQHLKFQQAFDISHKQAVAEWNKYGLILYKGSDYSDLYHEAWHEFTQYYLTQEEKQQLYDALGKRSGIFTDFKGKEVSYDKAGAKQKEEKLAEMFRDYMLDKNKPRGIIAKIFKKIKDFLNYIFKDKNEKLIERTFNTLRKGDLSAYRKSASNVRFTKLYRSIKCTDEVSMMTESDSYKIQNLVDNLMVSFLNFKAIYPNANFDDILGYMELRKEEGKSAADEKYKNGKINKDIDNFLEYYNKKFIVDNSSRFSPDKVKEAREYLDKLPKYISIDINATLTKSKNTKDAFKFIKATLCQMYTTTKLLNNNDPKLNIIDSAINNFGNIDLLGQTKNKESVGVVGFIMNNSNYFNEVEEDELDLDDTETALKEEHDPDPNSKSTIQRLDSALAFLLSTIPAYKLDAKGNYQIEVDDYGMQKSKNITSVVNMLNFLHGSINVKDMYDRLEQHAYYNRVENGKIIFNRDIVVNPMIKVILDRLGPYEFQSMLEVVNDTENPELSRFQLINKFWNVFATSEPINYQVNIDVEKDHAQDDYLQQKITDVSISAGEFSGAFWRYKNLYETKFADVTNTNPYVIKSNKGNILNVNKLIKKHTSKNKTNGGDFDKETALQKRIEFINATGIPLTYSKEIAQKLNTPEWTEKITRIWDRLAEYTEPNANKTIIYNPVEDVYLKYENGYSLRDVLKDIVALDMTACEDVNIEMIQNAEGNVVFKNQLNNTILIMVNHINAAPSYQDLLKDPAMKHLDVRKKILVDDQWVNNPHYNPDVARSSILGSMFDLRTNPDGTYNPASFGARKANTKINIVNFSGLKINEFGMANSSSGIKLFNADKDTKILADISLLLNGQQEFMRFADKGTSYGFTLVNNGKKGWLPIPVNTVFNNGKVAVKIDEDIDTFDTSSGSVGEKVIRPYLTYLISELERQDDVRMQTEMSVEEYDHEYLKRAYSFGFFDDILSDETKQNILNKIGADYFSDLTREEKNEIITLAIDDIKFYITKKVKEHRDLIDNTIKKFPGVIDSFKKVVFDTAKSEEHSNKNYNVSDEDFITGLAFLFFTNNQIYNIESIKLFFGDITLYNHKKEEFTKRIGGFGSTGQIFNDDETTRAILKNAHASSYAKTVLGIEKNPLYEEEHEGELKTAVCADTNPLTPYLHAIKEIVPEEFAKAYDRIEEESNAQGLISFDAYRELSIREGVWSPESERLYQMINAREVYERFEDKSKWEGDIPKEISWTDTLKFFPVRKFQYIGPLATNSKYLTAFHKYSLMPLIPNMLRVQVGGQSVGRNMMYIHDQMVKEGIHYITFNSGSKLGNISREKNIKEENKSKIKGSGDLIYDIDKLDYASRVDEFGNIKSRSLVELEGTVFTPNYIPIAYLKDQQAIHDELEDRVILSTQLKRLIENNLFDSGVPYDFIEQKGKKDENGKAIRSEKQAREVWKRNYDKYLFGTKDEKAKATKYLKENSKYFTLAVKFEDCISKLTHFAIESIKKEFDMEGKKASEKLINFIRKELEKKGIPQFAIDGVTDIRELQFSFVADQIENILMSTINSRVIRQKVHGGQFIQVSGSLWETPNSIVGTKDNPVANELEFYKNAIKADDTVKPAHCKIPLAGDYVHMLRLKHYDGKTINTLERLNECLRNVTWRDGHKEYLRFIAVRIPVQGHNSMEFLQIQEFIAPGCNNIIVCPTEIVIKSGGDYDIDKLSCVLPNISLINGVPMIIHSSKEAKVDKKELDKAKNKLIEADNKYSKSIKNALSKLMNEENTNAEIQQYANKLNDDRLELTQRINNYQTVLQDADLSKDLSDDEYLQLDRIITELKVQRNAVWDKIHELIKKDAELSAEVAKYKATYQKANEDYAILKSKYFATSRIAYENDLLSTMCEIIELKANNATLLTPNSNIIYASEGKPANILEANADYDKLERVFDNDKGYKVMSPTRCTEYIYNLNKHDDFNVGKTVLGPAAIDNVFSSLLRRVGAYMNHESATSINFDSLPQNSHTVEDYKGKKYDLKTDYIQIAQTLLSDIELINSTLNKNAKLSDNRFTQYSKKELKKYKSSLQNELERICSYCVQDMILPHNKTIVTNNECIDISGNFAAKTKDAPQYTINEEISEYITGCVDVAKGAWIKYIQANMVAIPIFMYMVQAGVPSDYVCYFIANPFIRKYLDAKLAQKSNSDLLTEKNYAESNNNILRAKILGGVDVSDAANTTFDLYIEMNRIEHSKNFDVDVNLNSLKERAISKGEPTDFDKRMLVELFRIEDQCEIINSVKLSVRVDQTKNNNVFNVLQKQRNIDKLNDDQRIDHKFIEAIKKDTVISSFFQGDFIKDVVDKILPYKLDKSILKASEETLDPITLKSLPSSNIESETIRFQTEFINFLWQKDFKTADQNVDLRYKDNPIIYELCRKALGEDVFPTSNPDVLTKFYQNLDYVFDRFDAEAEGTQEAIRQSNFYKFITNYNVTKKYNDPLFYGYIAALLSGNTKVLFRYGNLSYPIMLKTALLVLDGFNHNSFGELLFIDSFNVVRNKIVKKEFKKYKDKKTDEEKIKLANETNFTSSNLYFTFGTNNDIIGVLKEEYEKLADAIWVKTQLREKGDEAESFAGFTKLTDVDLDFMDILFNFMPTFGILQSGIHSSYSNSINALFPVNSKLNRLYEEFTMKSDEEKKALLLDFSNSFLNKFSASNALRLKDFSYDNFHEADESVIMDAFNQQPESKKTKDGIYCMHSGGAEGSDQIFGHCAAVYGIQVNHYTAEDKSSKKSDVTGRDISLVKITKGEYDYGYAKYEIAAKELGRDMFPKNTPQGGLLARDFIQAYNSDQIFAVGTIERNNVKGGTGYAVQMAIDMHNEEIYVYDQVQKSWYKIKYNDNGTHSWDKLDFIPKITSYNFAGIGTRKINDDGKNAIADLFRNSFSEQSISNMTYDNMENLRNVVLTHPNILFLFADNLDRTGVLSTGKKDNLVNKKVVSSVNEATGKYAERFKDTKTFMGYKPGPNAGLRGLNNAFPVTVKKRFKGLVTEGNSDKWNDSEAEEFEKVLDDDINVIKAEISSGAYKYVYFPKNFFFHLRNMPNLGVDADISQERTPKLYSILNDKMQELVNFVRQYDILINENKENDKVTFDTMEEYSKSPYSKNGMAKFLSYNTGSYMHFGNPFSVVNKTYRASDGKLHQTIRVQDEETAVKKYNDWLTGKIELNYDKERKNWILRQIQKGNLDNSILVTLKSDGKIADVIEKLINDSKDTFISTLDKKQREEFQKKYDKEMRQEDYVKDVMKEVRNGISGDSVKPFYTNSEISILNETLKSNNGRLNINSASRHTDPAFHKEVILQTLEDNDKKAFGAPDRIYAIEIWSKHDGLPMEEILQACKEHRVAPIVSFSISGLGDTRYEQGVLHYTDLLDSIKKLIDKNLLDPNFTTIRIDPFVPGITDLRDIDSIVEIASEMGIKRFTTSVMQSYGYTEGKKGIGQDGLPADRKIIQRFESFGHTKENYFNTYYGLDTNNKVNHKAKQEYCDTYAAHLIHLMETYDVTIMSCQYNLFGLKHAPCLDPAVVEKLVGTNEFNKETGKGCVGGCLYQSDILKYENKCYSGCTYCYEAQDNLTAMYYDDEGNLITDNPEEALKIAQVVDKYYEEDSFLIDQDYSININDAEAIINTIRDINEEVANIIYGQGSLFYVSVGSIENENIRNFVNNNSIYTIETENGKVIPMQLLDSLKALDTFKVNGSESIFTMKVKNPINYLVQRIDNANKTLHLYNDEYNEDNELIDDEKLNDLINTCKLG